MKYFLYALCLALIILKLTNFIDWSWWYVTMPIYGLGIILAVLLCLLAWLKHLNDNPMKRYKSSTPKRSKFQERLDAYMSENKKSQ